MPDNTVYPNKETRQAGELVATLEMNAAKNGEGTFDSAGAADVLEEIKHGRVKNAPVQITSMIEQFETGSEARDLETRKKLASAILDGVGHYEKEHGDKPSADVVLAAIHQGYSVTSLGQKEAHRGGHVTYDTTSATSNHHDQISMVTGRTNIAMTMAIAEAIPFAHYLPASHESNEAKLLIISHMAGSDWGSYRRGDIMDGLNNGKPFVESGRVIALTLDAGKFKGQITSLLDPTDREKCISVADGAKAVKVLRGRTIIYVDGFPCGIETNSNGTGENSSLGGEVFIEGTQHVISGFIKPDTGVSEVGFTPALPANTTVHMETFFDYEVQPELAPAFSITSQKFDIYAAASRAITNQTIDAATQYSSEVGLDIGSEAMLSLRTQAANERHYSCLAKADRLGAHNNRNWTFDAVNQQYNKSNSQIWEDFGPTMSMADQAMINKTMDYSSKFMYVGEKIKAQLEGLPLSQFKPSGIAPRAGIYRLGEYKGKQVYFNPNAVETANTSRITLIGKSSQVARSPFVLGDAVAPMAITFGKDANMGNGMGYYTRAFTSVNPHRESALGVATIDVQGLTI